MTTALWCVFVAGLLPYVAAVVSKAGGSGFDNNEPRSWLAKQEGFRARANAAQQNGFEAFAFFAVAVLVAHVTRGPQSLVWAVAMGATVWIFLTAAIPR